MSMAESFVPFFANGTLPAGNVAPSQAPTRLTQLLPQAAPPMENSPFMPAMANGAITAIPGLAPCPAAKTESAQPAVTLQHEDGRVTRIRVQCGCGQVIDLDCVY